MSDSSDEYFIRTGEKLVRLLRKHFHISGKDEDVRIDEEIGPESVKSFYTESLATVRPANLGPDKILPKPDHRVLRALYLGSPTANNLLNSLVRHSLYVDQILLTDPFQSIVMLDHERNVRDYPSIWMEVVVNKAIAVCAISDWIKSDIVRIMPNPFYYYRDVLFKSAEEWEKRGRRIPESYQKEMETEFISELLVSEEESEWDGLLDSLSAMGPQMTDEEKDHFKSKARDYESRYPVRFRLSRDTREKYAMKHGDASQMVSWGGGTPIHLAPEIADLTGSFMLFEKKRAYDTLVDNFGRPRAEEFQEMALAFQDLEFPFLHNVPIDVALQARREGHLANFRNYLREVWRELSADPLEPYDDALGLAFSDRLSSEYSSLSSEWKDIRRDLRLGAISRGILTGASAVVAGTMHWAVGSVGIFGSLASAVSEYRNISSRKKDASRNPLAIFFDLERRG